MSRLSPVRALRRQLKTIAADFADDLIPTSIAADFLNGGAPAFARIFDRRGRRFMTVQRRGNEPWAAFVARAKGEAANAAQAACTLIGGLPDRSLDGFLSRSSDPPRDAIVLPETPLHPSQVEALDLIRGNRRVVLVCGRRWGKSSLLVALAVDGLGSCWVSSTLFCQAVTKSVLGLPAQWQPMGAVGVGYAAASAAARPDRDPDAVIRTC